MMKDSITRKELYDKLWNDQLSVVSDELLINIISLRLLCLKFDIPLPSKNYWLQVQQKLPVVRIPLVDSGQIGDVILLDSWRKRKTTALASKPEPGPGQMPEEKKAIEVAMLKDKIRSKLILDAEKHFNGKNVFRDDGFVCGGRGLLEIKVAPENVDWSLMFFNKFIIRMKQRGHDVRVDGNDTHAVVMQEKIKVSFREKFRREEVKEGTWSRSKKIPIGLFVFKMWGYPPKEWTGKKEGMEDYLDAILLRLEEESREMKEWSERARVNKEESEKQELAARELKALKAREEEAFLEMMRKAERLQKVKMIREFVSECELRWAASGDLSEEQQRWLQWANSKIEWYDPFIEKDDDLLNDVDRMSLGSLRKESSQSWPMQAHDFPDFYRKPSWF